MRKSIAHKSKTFDQFLLLIAGLAMSACAFWVWSVMDHRRIPNRMGFFIVLNILTGFVLTWQAVALFRRTRDFGFFI